MIEVKNVTKTFDGFKALDELSLHVDSGTVYGLVGANGAGKTTVIKHMTGVYRPDSGSVTILDAPVYENIDLKKISFKAESSAFSTTLKKVFLAWFTCFN